MDIADEVIKMSKEERKIFRQTHDYHITTKEGSFEELIKKERQKKEKERGSTKWKNIKK